MRIHFPSSILAFASVVGLLFSPMSVHSQIPNAGFESWSGGNPVDWSTNNSPDLLLVAQTNVAHSGTSAAQGTALSAAGFGIGPALTSGGGDEGFPINFRPVTLHGFYTFTSVGGDYVMATVGLSKNGAGVGSGTALLPGDASSYTEFVLDIFYGSEETPDTAYIAFALWNPSIFPHAGSTFRLDDLSWGASSSVKETVGNQPMEFKLEQNYPNPFNPTTVVRYQLPVVSDVKLVVYDILGREVTTLVDEKKEPGDYAVTFDGTGLSSGIYLYKLSAGDRVETRRMILLR